MKVTERGWAGHFIASASCLFRRNTLLQHKNFCVIVSTVGNMVVGSKLVEIGYDRFYETMVFHSDPKCKYFDANVSKEIKFDNVWLLTNPDQDLKANVMHEQVVNEIKQKLLAGKI